MKACKTKRINVAKLNIVWTQQKLQNDKLSLPCFVHSHRDVCDAGCYMYVSQQVQEEARKQETRVVRVQKTKCNSGIKEWPGKGVSDTGKVHRLKLNQKDKHCYSPNY